MLLLTIIGATFAYFSATITETDKTQTNLKAAQLGIIFDGTQEIEALSIEPGWSADKKFTVENTSDYDMTFDINFTRVVNNFTRTSDLTATGSARFIDNDHLSNTVQMIGLNDTNVAGSTKTAFALPTTTGQTAGKYELPVDGTVDTTTNPATITEGTNVFKVARVFIPAHSKQEFTITFEYVYLAPTAGYAIGDSLDPSNQNTDQGKIFRTTISIIANGIDSGANQNHPANTTVQTNNNGNNNQGQQISYWTPTYFTMQSYDSFPPDPSELTTDYTTIDYFYNDVQDDVTVFKAYDDNNRGVCVSINGNLNCFKSDNASDEVEHVQRVFSPGSCQVSNNGSSADCYETMGDYDVSCTISDEVYCQVVYIPAGWQWGCNVRPGGDSTNYTDSWGQCSW